MTTTSAYPLMTWTVSRSDSPFFAEDICSSMLMIRPPSRCMAAEKLQEVRVLASKNKDAIT